MATGTEAVVEPLTTAFWPPATVVALWPPGAALLVGTAGAVVVANGEWLAGGAADTAGPVIVGLATLVVAGASPVRVAGAAVAAEVVDLGGGAWVDGGMAGAGDCAGAGCTGACGC
ncbi:hypothetical protein [Mycobacterium saskatchewanense]|uniref:hypothetical protein n=1 Tax=Mycobacterium saskatchewanense TaxID=220927 RepID=UPI00114E2165|nr:hypothetical protein [Mycobacterium saskatchewanense]